MKVKVKIIKHYDLVAPEEWAEYDDEKSCAYYFKNGDPDELNLSRQIVYQHPGIRRKEKLKDDDLYEIVYDTTTFRPVTARHLENKNGKREWEKDLFFKDFIEFWNHKKSLEDKTGFYSKNREKAQKIIFEQKNGFRCCSNIRYAGFLGQKFIIENFTIEKRDNEEFCSFCGLVIEKMSPFITSQLGDHYRDYLYTLDNGQIVWLAVSGLLDRNLRNEDMQKMYEDIIKNHNLNMKELIKIPKETNTKIYLYYPSLNDRYARFIFKAESLKI